MVFAILRYSVVCAAILLLSWSFVELRQEGYAVVIDDTYAVSMVVTNRDGLISPDGLQVVGDKIFIADEGGAALTVWAPGSQVQSLGDANADIASPEDLVVTNQGIIYFTDDDAGGLWRVDTTGKIGLVAGRKQGLVSTEGLALAPDGTLIVGETQSQRILRVSPQGDVQEFPIPAGRIRKAESMTFDEQGNLYIADDEANVVYQYDLSGRLHELITARDGIQAPESLCYSQGCLFIVDDAANKLYSYDKERGLKTLVIFAGTLKNVQGVAAASSHDIFVSVQIDLKRGRGCVLRVHSLGSASFESTANANYAASGQCKRSCNPIIQSSRVVPAFAAACANESHRRSPEYLLDTNVSPTSRPE